MANNANGKKIGAVMVVGGGIAGMQSALDLANSGFKVYLVEESSAIGGRMAQLDKTFPTNDCSMCMISPKLIEVSKHLNIEILTNSRVQSVEGDAGNFSVKVQRSPRYVNTEKCTACGDCITACPVDLPNEFEQGLSERKAIHKRYPQAVPSAFAISKAARPPCKITCPAGCNGQGYVALISKGEYTEALDHIKQWIPLPAVLGRICHHPCESRCNRSQMDQPVAIAPLKRFAADIVRQKRVTGEVPPQPKLPIDHNKAKVAVVGAGPSGIACAFDLLKLGYPVTIFEAAPQPGGQLWSSIPKYRLPKDILAEDIQDIIDLGIELKLNTPVSSIADLKAQGYKAVYLGIGAQKSRGLPIPGADLSQVWPVLDFLRAANQGQDIQLGSKVVVIGGGNTAMDTARTAVRLGTKEVHAVCLESPQEMPAHSWEISEAEEEGIRIHNSWGPKQIIGSNGTVSAIEFEKCTSVFDSQKRFNPVFDKSITQKIDCDTVIIAVGQAVDLSLLEKNSSIKTSPGGFLVADPITLATDESGVFAGGDAVTGPKSAVEAIAQGHEAAISIDRFLQGADLREGRQKRKEEGAPIPTGKHPKLARTPISKLSLEKRISSFEEIESCYTEEQARLEAERCLDCGLCSECLQCVSVCQSKAIDHTAGEEIAEIRVGSIVLAPGFDPFDAAIKGEYGYGRMPNVVTSMEFERILSASGPFQGQILRPSDTKHPIKIAWIQCVGSRDETCGKEYCSSVCCMYATKEAVIAREHNSSIQPTIFYNDLRAFGKGFECYYESAKKSGVRYIKSIPATVKELQQSHNLILEYTGDGGKKVQEEFDMVVLSVGIVPSSSARDLAKTLDISTDKYGFCLTDELTPNITSRTGIFVAGAFDTPMDIPESVMNASSAALLASQGIAEARGTLVSEKEYPPEKDCRGQEPRVGVFVCRCGTNIARVVDVTSVAEYAKTLPNVVHAEENLYTCSTDTQNKIIKAIDELGLNRVVVASCSPRTHESLFQDTCREGGINQFLFEMANIRDQCSWVHATHMPEATDKSKDLVRMAVARARTLEPLQRFPVAIHRRGLVIGGGLSGMKAALGLARQGFEVALVEKDNDLGGNLRHIHYTLEGSNPQALLAALVEQINSEPMIKVFTGAEIKDTTGFVGNYRTTIRTSGGKLEKVDHGIVILATGAAEYKPVGEYGYGQSDQVLTQVELEERIAESRAGLKNLKSVVMIQCVGSREEGHMYCSRICCSQAIKNAIKLKESNPQTEVYILYRDIRTYGMKELKYREARDKGVTFIRFDAERKPEVITENGNLKVRVFDSILGMDILIDADQLVLSASIRPRDDAPAFASKLKLPLTADGFYMETHLKLRPLDFVSEGMYLCGLAHSPKFISESIVQANGAVSRAMTILSQPHLMAGGIVAVVDKEQCMGCLTCVRVCPFDVPRINEKGISRIEAAACQGCGICASSCPGKAISVQHYKDEQVSAKTAELQSSVVSNQ
ncbi:MAG: FAD-dependent oxidoreductase [Dehalococcoidia bacterium]|nr:FAD-dependent oxidoreductase [Dehalococcoidia bacterium]